MTWLRWYEILCLIAGGCLLVLWSWSLYFWLDFMFVLANF